MGTRKVRVEELLLQALSEHLHSRWRSESVGITLTGVRLSEDLKSATVYFTTFGGRADAAKAAKFLLSKRNELRKNLGSEVILKYTPSLQFEYDISIERGARVMDLLNSIDENGDEIAKPQRRPSKPDGDENLYSPSASAKKKSASDKRGDKYRREKFDPSKHLDDETD